MKKIILLILFVFISCQQSNTELEFYTRKSPLGNDGSNRKPEFSITATSDKNHTYRTNTLLFLNYSIYTQEVFLRLTDNKFIAKAKKPDTNDFILFDLGTSPNQNNPIVIEYDKSSKTFDCVLEKKITTKENLEVFVFTIKNWTKAPSFIGGAFLDVKLFVTKKYGVIGSYLTNINSHGQNTIIVPAGDLLENYIDYSKMENITFK
jgi:hypothetical protein